jgi:hypothetical protein
MFLDAVGMPTKDLYEAVAIVVAAIIASPFAIVLLFKLLDKFSKDE